MSEEISTSNPQEDSEYSYKEKRQKLFNEIFIEMSAKDFKYKLSLSVLNKFLKKLKNVKSSGSWKSFFYMHHMTV